MKLRVSIALALFLATASVAVAHSTRYAWTAARAAVIVRNDVTVPLPAAVRGPLEEDLRAKLAQFQSMALTAQQDRANWLAAETYGNYASRFREALAKVRAGLPVETAQCTGIKPALKGKRFKHFTCAVTSAVLEVPSVQVVDLGPGKNPDVVEQASIVVGPYQARLSVHVTGPATIVYQTLG